MKSHFLTSDVDECSVSTHSCDQECYNEVGSFRCGCHRGYHLTDDLLTCEGTALADMSTTSHVHLCAYRLVNINTHTVYRESFAE